MSVDEGLAYALESLPTDQREVVALKIDGNLTFAQIGKVLGISPNTVASRLTRSNGKPLRYVIRDQTRIVYSIGPSGVDHGGTGGKQNAEGDLIFMLRPAGSGATTKP